jgi:hypothetical protein
MWKRDLHALHAAALPQIEVVERARTDAHQGLARPRNRIVGDLVAEDIRSSMCMKPYSVH